MEDIFIVLILSLICLNRVFNLELDSAPWLFCEKYFGAPHSGEGGEVQHVSLLVQQLCSAGETHKNSGVTKYSSTP